MTPDTRKGKRRIAQDITDFFRKFESITTEEKVEVVTLSMKKTWTV